MESSLIFTLVYGGGVALAGSVSFWSLLKSWRRSLEKHAVYSDPTMKMLAVQGDAYLDIRGGELSAPIYEGVRKRIVWYLSQRDAQAPKRYQRIRFIAGKRLEVRESDFLRYRKDARPWYWIHPVLRMMYMYKERVCFELYIAEENGDHFACGYPSMIVGEQSGTTYSGNFELTFTVHNRERYNRFQMEFDRQIKELGKNGRKWDGNFENPTGLMKLIDGFNSYEKRIKYDSMSTHERTELGVTRDDYIKLQDSIFD
jgi:hypothetical protein